MFSVALNAFRHVISGYLSDIESMCRAVGRFSDFVRYNLNITDRLGRCHSYLVCMYGSYTSYVAPGEAVKPGKGGGVSGMSHIHVIIRPVAFLSYHSPS